jgi:hypothetical protein
MRFLRRPRVILKDPTDGFRTDWQELAIERILGISKSPINPE